jgi:SAM-dependent methyltransferase
MSKAYFETNRANWNERADIHFKDDSGFYGIDRLIAGENLLTPIERSELPSLLGKRVAHFQCHIGTDTLSLKRLGAAEVVGLDFSSRALKHARSLTIDTGLEARFVEGSVYDAPALIGDGYDLAYTTWGTIVWLDDLEAWARAISGVLKPGGRFYFADSHPFLQILDHEPDSMRPLFDYETPPDDPVSSDVEVTYNLSEEKLSNTRIHEWLHSVSRVLNCLIGAGLTIDFVHEHYELPWMFFENMVPASPPMFRFPEGHPRLPLAWSILATKK